MEAKRMLDLFAGRLGWAKVFAARGWKVTAVDLVRPDEVPEGIEFIQTDVLMMYYDKLCGFCIAEWPSHRGLGMFDFVAASSPCEEFSVHGMKLFHPNPKYPEQGIRLFEHTRSMCEQHGAPYVMENVRPAQQFIGKAAHHCGPFYLWGNAVPPLMAQGITKGAKFGKLNRQQRKEQNEPYYHSGSRSKARAEIKAKMATIPPELANCVAEYAERILEVSE